MNINLKIEHQYTDNDNEENEYRVVGKMGTMEIDMKFETIGDAAKFVSSRMFDMVICEGAY